MKGKRLNLSVVRNPNYTISVIDGAGKSLLFRDITGEDLEFLDQILNPDNSSVEESQPREISFDQVVSILHLVNLDGIDMKILPRRVISGVFRAVQENILCNYTSKYSWLKHCYGLQNGSFANLKTMEMVPMTKFVAMIEIHNNAMDSLSKEA